MKRRLLLLVLGFPALVWSGELVVEPNLLSPGEPALVRWLDAGPVQAEVDFNGRSFPLLLTATGGEALLATDLDTPPGTYAVRIRLAGAAQSVDTQLQVIAGTRPEERLTLPEAMVSPKDPAILQRIEQEGTRLRKLFAQVSSAPAPPAFSLPVTDPLGSAFGLRRILNGKPRSPHAGVDFRSPQGTPVQASAAGVVALAEELYYTGKTLVLDHGNGLFSLYCHLSTFDCGVGQRVSAAEILGRVGSTGRSTGAHLHWGVKLRGDRIDPLALVALLSGEKP